MLWRVRTTLPDRPGALALLAQRCGEAGVNILGLQIFPGIESVTDELVLRTPSSWEVDDIGALVESAGGGAVVATRCTEAALVDQPTRYVQAARTILARPMAFPEVAAALFDADGEAESTDPGHLPDVMEMTVGDVLVQLRRTAPFTATEHARGAALADLVSDVLQRNHESSPGLAEEVTSSLAPTSGPAYVVTGDSVSALVDGVVVGLATLRPATPAEPDVRPVVLRVDPAYQRRGIGTRLLAETIRVAQASVAGEILISARSDNPAVLPMVLAAGLRGRIRMAGNTLTVRIPVGRPSSRAVSSG